MHAAEEMPDLDANAVAALRGVDVSGVVCTVGDWNALRKWFIEMAGKSADQARQVGTIVSPEMSEAATTWRQAALAVQTHGRLIALEMTRRPLNTAPPAAADLPPGLLEDAVDGAAALDVQNRSRAAANILAHALVNVVRRGWLASQRDPAVATLRDLADAVDEYLLGHAGSAPTGSEFSESRRVARQRLAETARKAWEVIGPVDAPTTRVVVPQPNPEELAAAGLDDPWDCHPVDLGTFVLHYDSVGGHTTCGHCENTWPCDPALARHSCEDSPMCDANLCAFREDWRHNRPDLKLISG